MPVEWMKIIKIRPLVSYEDHAYGDVYLSHYITDVWFRAKVIRPGGYVGTYYEKFYWRITYCPISTDTPCPKTDYEDGTFRVPENDGTATQYVRCISYRRKISRSQLKKVWVKVEPQYYESLGHTIYWEEKNGTILKVLLDGELIAENIPNGTTIEIKIEEPREATLTFSDITVTPEHPAPHQEAIASCTVRNSPDGISTEFPITFTMDGKIVDTRSIYIPAGSSKTVEFKFAAPEGTYELAIFPFEENLDKRCNKVFKYIYYA